MIVFMAADYWLYDLITLQKFQWFQNKAGDCYNMNIERQTGFERLHAGLWRPLFAGIRDLRHGK
jgi:hypothetical protein